jgi:hypothetical protein
MIDSRLDLQTFLDGRNSDLKEICLDLLDKGLVHWCKSLAARPGKSSELEKYVRENTFFSNWKYLQHCIRSNFSEPPKCPVCGEPRAVSMGKEDFLETCGDKKCTKEFVRRYNLEHYGVEWVSQSQEVRDKQKATFLKKYGYTSATQNPEVIKKIKATNIERYGSVCPMQNPLVKETSRRNQIEKYGVPNISMLESIKKKKETTFLEHYDTKTSLINPEEMKKIKQTCIEKYGVDNPFKSKEITSRMKRKYICDGIYFDSSWEVAVYLYCRDHHLNFRVHPEPKEYFVEKEKHLYYPDFEIEGDLIEVKGDMQIDEGGNTIPHPALVKKEGLDSLKEQILAKNECMRKWDVKVWSSEKIKFYLDYVKEEYGLSYLKNCRTSKD